MHEIEHDRYSLRPLAGNCRAVLNGGTAAGSSCDEAAQVKQLAMSVDQLTFRTPAALLQQIRDAEAAVKEQEAAIAQLGAHGQDTAEATQHLRELLGNLTELVRIHIKQQRVAAGWFQAGASRRWQGLRRAAYAHKLAGALVLVALVVLVAEMLNEAVALLADF
jgi:hypothetical protein